MVKRPKKEQLVKIHYAKSYCHLMPHHGKNGIIKSFSTGPGPINVLVYVCLKGFPKPIWVYVVVPRGNLNLTWKRQEEDMPDKEQEIFSVPKNDWTKLVVAVKTYKGAAFIDFRENVQPKGEDFFQATKKGFTFRDIGQVDQLIELLQENRDKLAEKLTEFKQDENGGSDS